MRNLREFAMSRLRVCFPKDFHRIVSELSQRELAKNAPAPTPQPAVVESKAAANGRCSVKGCVFPAVVGPFCRSHLADSLAEKSLLPSTTACAIANLGLVVAL